MIDILFGTWRDHRINVAVYIYRKTAIKEILRIRANTSDDLGILLYLLRLESPILTVFRREEYVTQHYEIPKVFCIH